MDSNEFENNHLVELGNSDYEIVDGEPDIVGWEVKNERGEKIGDVDELLFDKESRKVRYIIVDLDDNDLELDEDKKVLIPIGIAEIYSEDDTEEVEDEEEYEDESEDGAENETVLPDHSTGTEIDEYDDDENDIYDPADDGEVVIVPVTIEQLKQLPAYDKDNVTAESEADIRRVFDGGSSETTPTVAYNREDFYAHEHFNANNKLYENTEESGLLMPASAESIEPEIGGSSAPGTDFGEPTDRQKTITSEKDISDLQLPKTDEKD